MKIEIQSRPETFYAVKYLIIAWYEIWLPINSNKYDKMNSFVNITSIDRTAVL